MTNRPSSKVQLVEIDSEECIRCFVCCGCSAQTIFIEPDDGDSVPALLLRSQWDERELPDAVNGCPASAISVVYDTHRLTAEGAQPLA